MYTYAAPNGIRYGDIGIAMTFIVPASSCNLNCKFCVIKQRREVAENILNVSDYLYFIRDIIDKEQLAVIAIQGYEPLLPESWPYTKAVLELARSYALPRSFVTNGYLIEENLEEIIDVDPSGVSVSLDSASAELHDKMRGKAGAFEKTVRGIRALTFKENFAKKVTVGSVLMPGKREQLEGMPRLLAEAGVRKWSISPLVRIGRDKSGGPVQDGKQIVEDVLYLGDLAKDHGVSVVLDDELRTIPKELINFEELVVRRLERPDGLIRLNANGACSIGTDILRQVDENTPVWSPSVQTPSAFIDSIRRNEADVSVLVA